MATASVILRLLDLLVVGSMSIERLALLKKQIQAMVAEGRDPTEMEWMAIFEGIERDSARLD